MILVGGGAGIREAWIGPQGWQDEPGTGEVGRWGWKGKAKQRHRQKLSCKSAGWLARDVRMCACAGQWRGRFARSAGKGRELGRVGQAGQAGTQAGEARRGVRASRNLEVDSFEFASRQGRKNKAVTVGDSRNRAGLSFAMQKGNVSEEVHQTQKMGGRGCCAGGSAE